MRSPTGFGFASVAGLFAVLLLNGCGRSENAEPASDTQNPPKAESAKKEPLAPSDRPEKELQAAMADIAEKWAQVNSFRANMTMTGGMSKGPLTFTNEGTGTFEFLRHQGKRLFRVDMDVAVSTSIPGFGEIEADMLTVFDGEAVYSEFSAMGRKKVGRLDPEKANSTPPPDGPALLESLRQKGDVTLLEDAEVDGVAVYMIAVKLNNEARDESRANMDDLHVCFAKENGVRVKMTGYDEAGKVVTQVTFSRVDTEAGIDLERFTYTVPEGVEVEEMDPDDPLPALPTS